MSGNGHEGDLKDVNNVLFDLGGDYMTVFI